jgi:hypothetical protein
MNEHGWRWTPSEIRHAQLIEWIVQQSAERPEGLGIKVEPFYSALPDQSANTNEVARGDLDHLERASLIRQMSGLGGIEALDVLITQQGRAFAEHLQAARANKQGRRAAARDAMVDWLYSGDALSPPGQARDRMLEDPARGYWFAELFARSELDAASAWLHRHGMVEGATVDEAEGPVVLWLTDTGASCAEDFGSDTASYLDKQQYRAPGPLVNIGSHSGPLQVAGDNAHQVQNVGASANDLQVMITGITDIVRALVPGAANADQEQQLALAAISEQHVDRSALQRFKDWADSTVRDGATSAAVAVVSSTTTTLLIEAGHLATRLG